MHFVGRGNIVYEKNLFLLKPFWSILKIQLSEVFLEVFIVF